VRATFARFLAIFLTVAIADDSLQFECIFVFDWYSIIVAY